MDTESKPAGQMEPREKAQSRNDQTSASSQATVFDKSEAMPKVTIGTFGAPLKRASKPAILAVLASCIIVVLLGLNALSFHNAAIVKQLSGLAKTSLTSLSKTLPSPLTPPPANKHQSISHVADNPPVIVQPEVTKSTTKSTAPASTTPPPTDSSQSGAPHRFPVENSSSPSGWDYNLTHRCVKSPTHNSATVNYYQDISGCDNQTQNWTIANQAENVALSNPNYTGAACTGVQNQSFPIVDTTTSPPNGPLSIQWSAHNSDLGSNWTVDMKQNFIKNPSPCGDGTFTWFAFMDHAFLGGGPLPNPMQTTFSANVNYNDYSPSQNYQTRFLVGYVGAWDGVSHQIEVNLISTYIPAHTFSDPAVMATYATSKTSYIETSNISNELIEKAQNTFITIDWAKIVKRFVSEGFFAAPTQGWSSARTVAVYLGTEGQYRAASPYIADLHFTNFRISAKNCVPDTTCQQ